MYNTPIRFDGDIIITDPCYIMREDKKIDYSTMPYWWDFVTKTKTVTKNGEVYHYPPKATDYPDCREKISEDYVGDIAQAQYLLDSMLTNKPLISPTLEAEWRMANEAKEKWKEENKDDWELCECGENMEVLGIKTYLSDDTIYGDWSCLTVQLDDNGNPIGKLGNFCADSGRVAVFLLDEVLKYNPNFDYHLTKPWTTTCIKDFHGDIMLEIKTATNGEPEVRVVGSGNINFVGVQSGF